MSVFNVILTSHVDSKESVEAQMRHLSASVCTSILLYLTYLSCVGALTIAHKGSLFNRTEGTQSIASNTQSKVQEDFPGAIFPFYIDPTNHAAESYCWSLSTRYSNAQGSIRHPNLVPPTTTEWYFVESICEFGLRSFLVYCVKFRDTYHPEELFDFHIVEVVCPPNWTCEHFPTSNFMEESRYGAHCVPGDLVALYYNLARQQQICSRAVVFQQEPGAGRQYSQQLSLRLAINSRDADGKPMHAPLTWFEDHSPHRRAGKDNRFGMQEWTSMNGFSYIATTFPVVIKFCGSAGSAVALHAWRQYKFHGGGLFADQMDKGFRIGP